MASASHATRRRPPATHFSLHGVVARNGELVLIPQPRPLVDRVLAPDERLPGVSSVALFEQRLSLRGVFDSATAREAFYRAWGDVVPPSWTSKSTLSTANGGVWIWRYEAMLLMLAEARAFGLKQQATQCDRWLFDVSRIQARLGELRTVHAVRRGGMWAAIARGSSVLGLFRCRSSSVLQAWRWPPISFISSACHRRSESALLANSTVVELDAEVFCDVLDVNDEFGAFLALFNTARNVPVEVEVHVQGGG